MLRSGSWSSRSSGTEAGDRTQRSDGRWVLVTIVVGLPVVVLVVALAQRNWYPTGDLAYAELRMRSLPRHPPLIGTAGRIVDEQGRQGNHPGPLMFWVTWPLYALLGRSAWAFEAATALVNLAWLSLSVWLVKRRAGIGVCAWYGATALILIGGYGLNALSQPWNPWVALLPFTVLLLATWSALEGARWAPVLAVAAACYAIQGHVGYGPIAVPLAAIAVGAPVWRWWRDGRADRTRAGEQSGGEPDADEPSPVEGTQGAKVRARRSPSVWLVPTLVAVAVGVVAWSGPFLDVVLHQPNNVDKLIANFGSPSEAPIGLGRGIEAVLQSAAPFGAWVRGGEEVTGSVLPGLVLLGAWAVVAVLVAVRRAQPSLTRLNAVLAVVSVLGVFTVSRIFGALYLYVFRWIVAIVALQVFSLGWGLAVLLPRPPPRLQRRLAGVAAVGLVALSVFTTQRIVRQEIPYDQSWRIERVLAPRVAEQLDPDKRYLVTWDDSAYLGGLGFGLVLDLERRGFHVGTEPRFSAAVEPRRVFCAGDYDAVLTTVTGRTALARWDAMPGARRLASVDLRASTGGYDKAMAKLKAALAADGQDLTVAEIEQRMNFILLTPGQSRAIADPAAELVLGGVPSAVFLQDPAPTPPPLGSEATNDPCRN